MHDYFTRETFREFANDADGSLYRGGDIDRAQQLVIETLEKWARTAWPNVPESTPTDGDGTAAAARSIIDTIINPLGTTLVLSKLPVLEVSSLTADGIDVAESSYTPYLEAGMICFRSKLSAAVYVAEYSFGHTSCPEIVKSACMRAARDLLDQEQGRTGIPQNVAQTTVERTTFVFGSEAIDRPWPWSKDASKQIEGYWGADRPRVLGGV